MDISNLSAKEVGNLGERVIAEYLRRLGFEILGQNEAFKTGELDLIATKNACIHIIEVKTSRCLDFPKRQSNTPLSPAENLHANKIRKVVRTAEWYIAQKGWEGEWQVDGALVWIRERDGQAYISYYPQLLG